MLKTEYEIDRIIGGGYARGNVCMHTNESTQSLELFSPMDNRIAVYDLGTLRQTADGVSLVEGSNSVSVSSWMSCHNIICFDVTRPSDDPASSADQMILVVDEKGFGLFGNLTKDIALETVALNPTTCVVRFSHPFVAEESAAPSQPSVLNHSAPIVLPGKQVSYFVATATALGEVNIYTTPKGGLMLYQSVRSVNRYRNVFANSQCTSLEWSADNAYILVSGSDSTARILPREKAYDRDGETLDEDSPNTWRGRELVTTFATLRSRVVGSYFVYTAEEEDPLVLIVAADRRVALWKRSPVIDRKDAERWKFEARKMTAQEAATKNEESEESEAMDVEESADVSPEADNLRARLLRKAWDQQWKVQLRSEATNDPEKREEVIRANVASSAFAQDAKMLITGLEDGTLAVFQLDIMTKVDTRDGLFPLSCTHVVSVSCFPLTSLQCTASASLIAIGVPRAQTLMVYDWRRSLFSFMRQGHVSAGDAFGKTAHNIITSVAYSSDGRHLVTGGNDGRIKVWEAESGQCMQTFIGNALKTPSSKLSENTQQNFSPYLSAGVTALLGGSKSNAFYALTKDGVIRGYDIAKAICFRTFTVEEEVLVAEPDGDGTKLVPQMRSITPTFTCMALDHSEEVLIAATDFVVTSPDESASVQSSYYIYVFSTQSGAVMERLSSGHTAPITSINFHPSGLFFATTSWDKATIVWKLFASREDGDGESYAPKGFGRSYANSRVRPVIIEHIPLNAEGLYIEFADDGQKMSVLDRDGEVHVVACERITGTSIASLENTDVTPIEPWEVISSWNARRDAEGGWTERSQKTPMVSTMKENKKNYYNAGNVNPIVRRDASIAYFDHMRFTPSSMGLLLAGKHARYICLYHVTAGTGASGAGGGVLLRKWNVSLNRSINGNIDMYPWRKRKGNPIAALGMVDEAGGFLENVDHLEEDRTRRWLSNAGKRLDLGAEASKRYTAKYHTQIHNQQETVDSIIGVHALVFARSGEEWVAATPSGVLVFALPSIRSAKRAGAACAVFRPLAGMMREYSIERLNSLLQELQAHQKSGAPLERYLQAILIAVTLRLSPHTRMAMLLVPREHICGIVGQIPQPVLNELLGELITAFQMAIRGGAANEADEYDCTAHIERILLWVRMVLALHGQIIRKNGRIPGESGVTMANRLHRLATLFADFESLARLVEENTNTLAFLCATPAQKKVSP